MIRFPLLVLLAAPLLASTKVGGMPLLLAMLGLAYTKTFRPFLGLMLVRCLLYVPTISIPNSIAVANMKDVTMTQQS